MLNLNSVECVRPTVARPAAPASRSSCRCRRKYDSTLWPRLAPVRAPLQRTRYFRPATASYGHWASYRIAIATMFEPACRSYRGKILQHVQRRDPRTLAFIMSELPAIGAAIEELAGVVYALSLCTGGGGFGGAHHR